MGADVSVMRTGANLLPHFRGPLSVARFLVGPDGLPSVQERVDSITAKQFRDSGYSELPGPPRVVDQTLGIVQFGPRPDRRGYLTEPIEVLEQALGVKRLPEPIHTVVTVFPLPTDGADYRHGLLQALSGLIAMGGVFRHKVSAQAAAMAVDQRYFSSNPMVTFTTEQILLTFSINTCFDLRGHRFHLRAMDNKLTFVLTAALRQNEDQNSQAGHDVLAGGLTTLLEPFLTDTAAIRLAEVDPLAMEEGWYIGHHIALTIHPDVAPHVRRNLLRRPFPLSL